MRMLKRLLGRSACSKIDFIGDFKSWDEARSRASGYDSPAIVEKTLQAVRKVVNGEAAFERDSVAFEKLEHPFALLAGLLRAAACSEGRLSVLDFGGSLGSSFFQCRPFLQGVMSLRWSVVEQPDHVRCGREELESPELAFFERVEDCIESERPNVLLLGSVLQYLDEPSSCIRHLLSKRIRHVIVDRTAFHEGSSDRLTVQTVPEWIYPASYPAWFFNERKFVARFTEVGYRLLAEYDCGDRMELERGRAYFKGFIFVEEETR